MVEMINAKKITKTWDGSLIGVWKGKLMEGEWYGDKIHWSDNGTWSGDGRWEGEDLFGKWKVKGGKWWSNGGDTGRGGWKGSGTGEVDSTIVEFKNSVAGILVAILVAGTSTILNIVSGPLNASSGLGWITRTLNIFISLLLILGVIESKQRGKWELSGTWEDKEEYRILYIKKGDFKLGYHKGDLYESNFNWEDVPGKDSKRFMDFLKRGYGFDWVKKAEINKTDDGKMIRVSTEKNSLSLRLDDMKNEVNLIIDDGIPGRTKDFSMKIENSKLNIEKCVGSIKMFGGNV